MFGSTQTQPSGFSFGGSNASNAGASGFGKAPTSSGFGSQSGGLFGSTNNSNPSANTGVNNTSSGGLFGAKQANTGGLFGASSSNNASGASLNPPAANSGGLFGSNNNTANTNTGLFGGQNQAQGSSQTASGGLFGLKPAAPASGGLFGGNTASNTQSGGLFGANNASNASNSTGGGLFGNASNNASGGGLFGGNNAASGTTGTSGGLFGAKPATGGLFGSGNNAAAPGTGGGLFGGNSAANNASSGLFGNNNPQQQSQQLTAMSRVGDLPPQMKKELEDFDRYIETQHLIATTLQADMAKHDALIKSIPKDVDYLHKKLTSATTALKYDTSQLARLRALNNDLTEDISKIMQLILQLSTPGTKLLSSFQLNEFFIKKIKDYRETLDVYERLVKESEEAVGGLEKSCVVGFGGLFQIVEVIRGQYNLFMELCDTVAQLHNTVSKMK